jgi:AcrR family transcriptional regulator
MTHGERQRQRILDAGVALWAERGRVPTARQIAARLDFANHSAVYYHFGTAEKLNDALAARAVQSGNSRVIVQLIGMGHTAVSALSETVRADHLRAVSDHTNQ